MLLATSRRTRPSFVLFRAPDMIRAVDYANAILLNLSSIESDLLAGCVVTFRHGRLRVRSLPLGGPQ